MTGTSTIIFFSQNFFEVIKFITPPLFTLLAGYIGVRFGLKQIKIEKRLEFREKQLKEFYSPLLGRYKYIRAKSEYRVMIKCAGNKLWKENANQGISQSIESIESEIKYSNEQFHKEFLPMYREMLLIFRDGYWLAESETTTFYNELVEYVEGWNRVTSGGAIGKVMREVGHSEEKLKPFYEELEKRTKILRCELSGR